MNLYWVTTEDHHEDWFVIAPSLKEACKFYENYEGYDRGEAKAEKTSTPWLPPESYWPMSGSTNALSPSTDWERNF